MAIIGIGADIIEVARIKKAFISNASFLARYFTEAENVLFESRKLNPQTVAANFAAKEAFVKALGIGFSGIHPSEIEALRDECGKPVITVYGAALEASEKRNLRSIHVSLSHTSEYAQAFVVLES